MTTSWGKIVTHTDFDGVVSAALCCFSLDIANIVFAGPTVIGRSLISISDRDVVCDLPYPLECGLWFDHHPGNIEELRLRGYDPAALPGRFDLKDSCARVVFEYFSSRVRFPAHFEATVEAADIIDAFRYRDIADWRREAPGKVIDCALRMAGTAGDGDTLRRKLVFLLRDHSLEAVAVRPEILQQYQAYKGQEEKMMGIIREASYFLRGDDERELIIVDLTRYNRRPLVMRNLAFLLHPTAKAVVEVRSFYRRGVKTNDFTISISLSPNVDGSHLNRDLGEMMRTLNIGDGHAGAAAGAVKCRSKDEMIRKKGELLNRILSLWKGL